MKVIRLFLTMLSLVTVVSASAQFTSAPAPQTTSSSSSNERVKAEKSGEMQSNSAFFSFDVARIKSNNDNVLGHSGTGFSLGYMRSMPMPSLVPFSENMTLDFGGIFSYSKYNYEKGEFSEVSYDSNDDKTTETSVEYKGCLKYSTLTIPVSAAYHYQLSDNLSIVPYAGLNIKLAISGSHKVVYEGEYEVVGSGSTDINYSGTANLFDEDDMGRDMNFNRFTLGYQLGFDVEFSKFYVGFNFNQDFVRLNKYYRYRSSSVRAGMKF